MSQSRIVCAIGVPHVPVFPHMAMLGDAAIGERYARVKRVLDASDPSLLVVVASDHLNTFFLDRLPTFSIALGDIQPGPIDNVEGVAQRPIPTHPEAASHMADSLIHAGFDLMRTRETGLDHAAIVPLYFLNDRDLPVVALNLNAYVPPLPAARRCHDLGIGLAKAIGTLPDGHRVAVIASGAFSQEVGGPRVDAGKSWSVPCSNWARRVAENLTANATEQLLAEAEPDRIRQAGSVAGEVLTWITLLGAINTLRPHPKVTIDYREGEAFAFGSWQQRGETGDSLRD